MPYINLRNGDVKHVTWRDEDVKANPIRVKSRPENLSKNYRILTIGEWLDEIRKDQGVDGSSISE